MKTVAIIQARMGSTRFPGKVLAPISNSNALQIIVDKCKASNCIDQVVVATSENELDKIIQHHCLDNNIEFYVGSEEDVLLRVKNAAWLEGADIVIDITADCPFVDLSVLPGYLTHIKQGRYDYVSNVIDRTFPDGLDLQIYTFKALARLDKLVSPKNLRQHVGWNFTQFPKTFRLFNVRAKAALHWPELRITLDTQEDYLLIKTIANELGVNVKPWLIIEFLRKNRKLLKLNAEVIGKQPGE
jgi:spore coat polysaccharide biosynthesis protein SpsF